MPSLPPVLHEDAALLVLDKPAGLAIAPERAGDRGMATLMDLVRQQYGPTVANVHRIDTEASGVVLCARTKPALDFLSGQFQAKTVEKVHVALVVGLPAAEQYTVDLVLKPDAGAPGRMCVVKSRGQAAVTEVAVPARFGRAGMALVECRPQTGRQHQVRLHLAASGTPILNDPLYGNGTPLLLSRLKRGYKGREDERPLISRLALHAAELTFTHPETRERLTVRAPCPPDLAVALKYLEKFGQ